MHIAKMRTLFEFSSIFSYLRIFSEFIYFLGPKHFFLLYFSGFLLFLVNLFSPSWTLLFFLKPVQKFENFFRLLDSFFNTNLKNDLEFHKMSPYSHTDHSRLPEQYLLNMLYFWTCMKWPNFCQQVGMLMVVIHVRFEQFLTSYASHVTSGIYQVLFTQKTPENAKNIENSNNLAWFLELVI